VPVHGCILHFFFKFALGTNTTPTDLALAVRAWPGNHFNFLVDWAWRTKRTICLHVILFLRGQVKQEVHRSQPTSSNELEQQILDTSAAVPLHF